MTAIMLNYTKKIISENYIVLIKETINQVNQNIDEMLKTQVYAVSQFIMNDEEIYTYLSRFDEKAYADNRLKEVDAYLIQKKVNEQYYLYGDDISLAAIISNKGQIYNLSYPVNDEVAVEGFIAEGNLLYPKSRGLNITWYPLTSNDFKQEEEDNPRVNHVVIARRNMIKASNGQLIGEQMYTVCEEAIYEKYKHSELIREGQLFIVDRQGRLISHSDVQKVARLSTEGYDSIIQEVLSKPNQEYFVMNNEELIIQEPLNEGNWIAIAIMPTHSMYKNVSQLYSLFIMLLIIFLIIAGSSITLISERTVKPMKKIIKSMEAVEQGDFSVNVQVKGQYEFSKLAKYYNNMIARINQLIEEEYKLEKKKKSAELDALMAQINPHFLYNTLESIVWKARAIGAEDISQMAYSLGRFFRISVNKGQIIISVREELNHVKAYVDIQKIRYGNKFDLVIECDEHIQEFKTLKLLLQPIVENAIMYGIEDLEGQGLIKISIIEELDNLLLRVEDNGIGINHEDLSTIISELNTDVDKKDAKYKIGIGLRNVHQRIGLYFGDKYGVSLSSQINKGTRVEIRIPRLD